MSRAHVVRTRTSQAIMSVRVVLLGCTAQWKVTLTTQTVSAVIMSLTSSAMDYNVVSVFGFFPMLDQISYIGTGDFTIRKEQKSGTRHYFH